VPKPQRALVVLAALIGVSLAADDPIPPLPSTAPTPPRLTATLHEDFETTRPSWRQEDTDATVDLRAHERSDRGAHDGKTSERFEFVAGAGSYAYYSHKLPRIPLTPDLRAVLYVKSNRAGLQVSGRVVLPNDIDPETRQPAFLIVPGGQYDQVGRWQRLEITDFIQAVEAQARILRVASNGRRLVSLQGAYLEKLVVNLFGGPGATEAFLDDLTISPVPEGAAVVADERPAESRSPSAKAPGRGVRLLGNHLTRDGFDWVPTIVRASGADPAVLRQFGFNVLSVDLTTDTAVVRDAIRRGFLLMPHLNTPVGTTRTAEEVVAAATSYPFRDHVAFWYLDDALGADPDREARRAELDRTRKIVTDLHDRPDDFPRLTTASIAGEFPRYAQPGQSLDIFGAHPAPYGTCMEPIATLRYLEQRRNLTALNKPGGLFWSWVQARPPAAIQRAVWGYDTPPPWGVPRVQPEQLRIWAYAALAAGYRGIGFLADGSVTSESGRPLLTEMALLRAEIDLIETIIAQAPEPIPLLNTFPPDAEVPVVFNSLGNSGGLNSLGNRQTGQQQPKETPPHASIKAASLGTKDNRGRLLLVADFAPGTQWQPPQLAINNLKILVRAPETAQALEFSPGGWRFLEHERSTGGIRITVPDFSVTSLILVSTDLELMDRIKKEVTKIAPVATTLAINQEQQIYNETVEIDTKLRELGHVPERSSGLLETAREALNAAREFHERGDYLSAWSQTRLAGKVVRHTRRAHFELALKEYTDVTKTPTQKDEEQKEKVRAKLNRTNRALKLPQPKVGTWYPKVIETAVASPPLTSFNTLPQHYVWMGNVQDGRWSPNLAIHGNFENEKKGDFPHGGWEDVSYEAEGYSTSIVVDTPDKDGWNKSSRVLKLQVDPDKNHTLDTLPAYFDHPQAAVQSPPVKIGAGQLVRIRAYVRMIYQTPPGLGGLIMRDSIGGEALQFRTTEGTTIEWREVILYRRAASDCDLTVTFGLAGFGFVQIDDLRIDRLELPLNNPSPSANVARGAPRRPTAGAPVRATR
jgi:hypothetical protein